MLSQEERGAKRGLDSASDAHGNGLISSEYVYLFVLLYSFLYLYFNLSV